MTDLVPRTVTEIGEDGLPVKRQPASDESTDRGDVSTGGDSTDWRRWLEDEDSRARAEPSRSLEAFRKSDAYVLLGAPGAGKTELFEAEGGRPGCHYITARDFLALRARPEWEEPDATLFIDGLDEKRAGSADGRTPLDDIRAKLDSLGRPRFRLSCREADWFGANDRTHLDQVAKGGKVKVLRLEPLSDQDIRELLGRHPGVGDADEFMEEARQRGIDHLLTNPQTLKMLADAVAGGTWPGTRTETFELACEKLAQEFNRQHRLASRDGPAASELLAAAGRLCAILLLTGRAGYATDLDGDDSEYLDLASIPGNDRATLRLALNTRLFESPEEDRRVPTHRQIAEFLAARYLTERIDNKLPVRRVLALMTGGDGGLVSELRGLAAWLATRSKVARGELIERDPLGTILYGDAGGFSPDEKRQAVLGLERMTRRNPWAGSALWTDPRLGCLAAPDMEEVFRIHLREPTRGDEDAAQHFVLLLLQSLIHGSPIPALAETLMSIARDDRRWPQARLLALDAFIHNRGDDAAPAELLTLLADIHAGTVSDLDDDLLGTLLSALYPASLSAADITRHLREPRTPGRWLRYGRYARFWRDHAPEHSTPDQLAELLDALVGRFDELLPVLAGEPGRMQLLGRGWIPLTLLARFLATSQVPVPTERLFDWLGIASDRRLGTSPHDADPIRLWLSDRPAVQREILAAGATRCSGSSDFSSCMQAVERRLFRARRPADFGAWCLDQAIAATVGGAREYFVREVARAVYGPGLDEGLSRATVEERIRGRVPLEQAFRKSWAAFEEEDAVETEWQREFDARMDALRTRERRRRMEWRDALRSQEMELRENRSDPEILYQLAMAYFGWYTDVEGDTPCDRLRTFLDDDNLIAAVLDAFRGAVGRSDVPVASEIIRLHAENRRHSLALPFLAGLEELAGEAPEREVPIGDSRAAQAFAFHYTVPSEHSRNWYEPLLQSRPGVAADVLTALVRREMQGRGEHFFEIYKLGDSKEVARLAALPLLDAFPLRCTAKQADDLSYLLRVALLHCDGTELLQLIGRKLARPSMNATQRVYWLGAALFASATFASAKSYWKGLEEYVEDNERRLRHLAAFLTSTRDDPFYTLIGRLEVPALALLVRLLAAGYRPRPDPFDSVPGCIRAFIDRIASNSDPGATDSLISLREDQALCSWRPVLVDALERQNALRRDAEFRHPDVAQVVGTLGKCRPANAADLAALTVDLIAEISRRIRNGNTNDWRQYWNVDRAAQSWKPRHEDDCRDALLSDLQQRMAGLGIDAAPEGRYAEAKRSDIRVSYGGFNVPVEIKKSTHRDLWSATRSQLIARYTRDPGAAGYGIYLAFWFGNEPKLCQMPESGSRPRSAAEIEERLRDTLTPEEARLISICVIDVALP